MAPVNIGERSSEPRMMSWVRALVWVIQQGSWRGCCARLPRKENTGTGSSPCCSARREKSMVRPSRRGGVPVLSLPAGRASSRRRAASRAAGSSPMRPAAKCSSPTWIRPARKVPAVSTTVLASKRTPMRVTIPVTRSPLTLRSSTDCWNTVSRVSASRRRRIAFR